MASKSMTAGQITELREGSGQAIRPPAVALLTIDTRDQIRQDQNGFIIQPYNPNQVYINKQQSLANGYFTRIGLTEINLNWNTPNIIGTQPWANNTLTLQEGAAYGSSTVVGTATITMPEGFYSPNQLAYFLTQELNSGGGTFGSTDWLVTYSEISASFSISEQSVSVPFRIVPQNQGPRDDLCSPMGLTGAPQTFNKDVFGGFAPMCYTPYVDVVSQQLTKKQNVNDNSSSVITGQNLLARVYLNPIGFADRRDATTVPLSTTIDTNIVGCKPFTYHEMFQTPKQIFWDTQEFINVIDITLQDYKGRVLYAPYQAGSGFAPLAQTGYCANTTYYQLTLQVTET